MSALAERIASCVCVCVHDQLSKMCYARCINIGSDLRAAGSREHAEKSNRKAAREK